MAGKVVQNAAKYHRKCDIVEHHLYSYYIIVLILSTLSLLSLFTTLCYYVYVYTLDHDKSYWDAQMKFLSMCMWLTGQCDSNDRVLPSGHSQNSIAGWVDGHSFTADSVLEGEFMFSVWYILSFYCILYNISVCVDWLLHCVILIVFQWTRVESPTPLLWFWLRLQKRRACKCSTRWQGANL